MNAPRLSVILPVYNAAPFLQEALDSIFSQTFSDFEIIAINDGSTDRSSEILLAAQADPRLHVITRENRGLVPTLNQAISEARGEFLARMDADDISLPTRLAKQLQFLETNSKVAVVGTWTQSFGVNETIWKHPADPATVSSSMIFRCPLAHPSVMMRGSLFTQDHFAYDPAARHVEDYALWIAVSGKHQLGNLPEVLLRYRTHAGQVSTLHTTHQQKAAAALQLALIADRLLIAATLDDSAIHRALAFSALQPTPAFVACASTWLHKLAAANSIRNAFPHEAFLRTLTGRFVSLLRFAAAQKLEMPDINSSPFVPFILPGALTSS